jgi:hypothetical protein
MVCTLLVTKNSSKEKYMEKKHHYKGRQPNAYMNATYLVGFSSFLQRNLLERDVAQVSKFLHVDMEITNTSNSQCTERKHLMNNSIVCQESIYINQKFRYMKTNLEVTTFIQCIKDCFYILNNNGWKYLATISILW